MFFKANKKSNSFTFWSEHFVKLRALYFLADKNKRELFSPE